MSDNEMIGLQEAYKSAMLQSGFMPSPGFFMAFMAGAAYGALSRNSQDIQAALMAAVDQACKLQGNAGGGGAAQ